MNKTERAKLIQAYSRGYDEVMQSLDGFPTEALTSHPLEGKWSAAEIVHHLADSEMASALRLRKLLTEDNAIIYGYDQEAYASQLKYNTRDLAPALDAFRAARATTAQILNGMSEEDWQRQGWHSESGAYSAEKWLSIYADHAHNHASQIARLKTLV